MQSCQEVMNTLTLTIENTLHKKIEYTRGGWLLKKERNMIHLKEFSVVIHLDIEIYKKIYFITTHKEGWSSCQILLMIGKQTITIKNHTYFCINIYIYIIQIIYIIQNCCPRLYCHNYGVSAIERSGLLQLLYVGISNRLFKPRAMPK